MITTTIDTLSDTIVEYFCNVITSAQVAEIAGKDEQSVSYILSLAQIEWDAVGYDQEGETEAIERETAEAIIAL